MSEVAIRGQNITKIFRLYSRPKHRLLEALHPLRKQYHTNFKALDNVSFEINKGDSVGIIGTNGAGKSTLLKIITGVQVPSSGHVEVKGRIAALLELGAGFNPELSGLENVYFQGAIMGFERHEMIKKVPEILDFADIGEFIDQPVKSYSSGMFARLAFSIAIHVDPDILIVDEALSVGDVFFQTKCMLKMRDLLDRKKVTLLFVSHSTSAVRNLCSKALLLEKGQVVDYGPAARVVEKYFVSHVEAVQETKTKKCDPFEKMAAFGRVGNGKGHFTAVSLNSEAGEALSIVDHDQNVCLKVQFEIEEDIPELGFGFHIRNQDGVEVLYWATGQEVEFIRNAKAGMTFTIENKFSLPLLQGGYTVALVLSRPIDVARGEVEFVDFIPIAYHFEVAKRTPVPIYGLVGIHNQFTLSSKRIEPTVSV